MLEVAYPTLEAQSRTRKAPAPPPSPEPQEPAEVAAAEASVEAQVEAAPEASLETPSEPKPRGAFASLSAEQTVAPTEPHVDAQPEAPLDAEPEADADADAEEYFDEEYGSAPEDIVAEYLRTARAQYVESELHRPLRSILFGTVGWSLVRTVLLALALIVYNAALGYMAWRAWDAAGVGNDRLLVPLVIGIGAVLGWIVADVEHAYRSRSRFEF